MNPIATQPDPASASTKPVACLRGVRRVFGSGRAEVHALRGVDLDIFPGELLMIIGPSGCGKTTMLSILSGVLNPTEGTAEVFGVDWRDLNEDGKSERRAVMTGFIFQEFRLIPTISAVDNVTVPLLIAGRPRAEAYKRAADMLDRVGLGDRLKAMPRELSGGMQQRVSIARALVGNPRMLICDEPTANLDGRTGQNVMELIRAASLSQQDNEDRCVVVVTHDNRIYHYADRIVEMEDGRFKPEVSQRVLDEAKRIPTFDDDSPSD